MKKSLLITLDFLPARGGVSAYYTNLCASLPRGSIAVLAPAGDPKQTELLDRTLPYPVIRSEALAKFLTITAASSLSPSRLTGKLIYRQIIAEIDTLVKRQGIGLLHAGQILPLGTAAMLYGRLPYVVYLHGLDILATQRSLRKKMVARGVLRKATAIITNSHFTADAAMDAGAEKEKITVVYPCPNITATDVPEWLADDLSEKLHLSGKRIVLAVGRLVKRKGFDLLISALPEVLKRHGDLRLVIVGSGPEAPGLYQQINQLAVRDYVSIVQHATNDELAALYELSDVFALPARRLGYDVEGFGIVYLEANLFGKPVIGTKTGGIPEAIVDGKTGILIDENDADALASAIARLLDNPSLATRLGIQGMQRVAEQFTWQSQVEKIKPLLQ